MKEILSYVVVFEIILFSGGVRFNAAQPQITMILYVLTSFFFYLCNHSVNNTACKANFKLCILLLSWVFLTNFITIRDEVNNRYLNYVMYAIGSAFCISVFDYNRFKLLFLKCFNLVLFFSILTYILFAIGVLHGKRTVMGTYELDMVCYLFNVEENQGLRLSGPYWEPGQLQIVIYYMLCMFYDDLSDFFKKPIKLLKKFGIIILALLLTQSTMAYLTLSVLLLAIIISSTHSTKFKFSLPFILIGGIFAASFIMKSSVVEEKISEDGDNNQSYIIRQADNLALIQMTIDYPYFGTGVETKTYENLKISYDSTTSSNGWLNTSAMLGIPYLLLIFFLLFKKLYTRYKYHGFIIILLLWIVLIMCQSNEAAVYLPYIYLYIYSFKNRSDEILQIQKNNVYHNNTKV